MLYPVVTCLSDYLILLKRPGQQPNFKDNWLILITASSGKVLCYYIAELVLSVGEGVMRKRVNIS